MSRTTLVRLTAGTRSVIVPAAAIRKVVEARGVTPVPLTRPDVAGVMVLDGHVAPVHRLVDLSVDFEESAARQAAQPLAQDAGEVVLLEVGGVVAGFLVDRTHTVRSDAGASDAAGLSRALLVAAGALPPEAGGLPAARAALGER